MTQNYDEMVKRYREFIKASLELRMAARNFLLNQTSVNSQELRSKAEAFDNAVIGIGNDLRCPPS
jgi:hypothetical protein